ncbi:MAG: hypothetical protein AAB373_04195 [Patescibacteria group bacterium]
METRVKQVQGPTAIFKKIALISTLVVAIAAFLPWISAEGFDISTNGMSGDGVITLILAAISFLLILINKWKYVPVILLLLAGAVGVMDWVNASNADASGVILNVEIGIYLTVGASALALISFVIHWIKNK